MTVSRTMKRLMWLALVVTCLAVYVVLILTYGLGNPWIFFGATQLRAFVPAVSLYLIGRDLMRFVHAKREEEKEEETVKIEGQEESKSEGEGEEWNPETCAAKPLIGEQGDARSTAGQSVDATACRVRKDIPTSSPVTRQEAASTEKTDLHRPLSPQPSTSSTQPSVEPANGEALFDQARALPHQMVPDFATDGPYLELLGKAAAKGYAPALAKLGEYAMRRVAWVEAYYWMSMAKRQGMRGLTNVMREIRKNWSLAGFPNEAKNVHPLFTLEAGSIGRALLHVDSGHEAAKAKAFLKANHPEFIAGPTPSVESSAPGSGSSPS